MTEERVSESLLISREPGAAFREAASLNSPRARSSRALMERKCLKNKVSFKEKTVADIYHSPRRRKRTVHCQNLNLDSVKIYEMPFLSS